MNQSEEERWDEPPKDPEVRAGQVWDYNKSAFRFAYPMRIRVICRYPFAEAADGPLWIIEGYPNSLGKIYRLPELSLRLLYDLVEDASA